MGARTLRSAWPMCELGRSDATRSAFTASAASWTDSLAETPQQTTAAPPIGHCWYDGPYGRQAALLPEWRSIEGHHNGHVVAAPDGNVWAVIEWWVGSGR